MSPSRSFLALICFAALGAAPNVAHAMVPAGAAAGAANPGHPAPQNRCESASAKANKA